MRVCELQVFVVEEMLFIILADIFLNFVPAANSASSLVQ